MTTENFQNIASSAAPLLDSHLVSYASWNHGYLSWWDFHEAHLSPNVKTTYAKQENVLRRNSFARRKHGTWGGYNIAWLTWDTRGISSITWLGSMPQRISLLNSQVSNTGRSPITNSCPSFLLGRGLGHIGFWLVFACCNHLTATEMSDFACTAASEGAQGCRMQFWQ